MSPSYIQINYRTINKLSNKDGTENMIMSCELAAKTSSGHHGNILIPVLLAFCLYYTKSVG